MTPSRAVTCGILGLLLLPAAASRVHAYLKLGAKAGDRTDALKWQSMPVRYFITDRGVSGVTATQLQTAVTRSFGIWDQVGTAETSSSFVGFTAANAFEDDAMNVIGFLNRPDLERVLGATTFLIDTTNGQILEADIFLNASFPWSVAPSGETGRFDVESIAVHELGHLFGLGHSAIGETELRPTGGRRVIGAEAVMFPIAFAAGSIDGRTLKADDVAGLSDIYPTGEFRQRTGSVSGRVTKDGKGVYGAHIVAMNVSTGSLVGNFVLSDDGSFVIAGLEPGPHVLRVEPLDDAEIDSFFQETEEVDVDFRATFYDRLVAVPWAGSTRQVEIVVRSK